MYKYRTKKQNDNRYFISIIFILFIQFILAESGFREAKDVMLALTDIESCPITPVGKILGIPVIIIISIVALVFSIVLLFRSRWVFFSLSLLFQGSLGIGFYITFNKIAPDYPYEWITHCSNDPFELMQLIIAIGAISAIIGGSLCFVRLFIMLITKWIDKKRTTKLIKNYSNMRKE